MIRVLFDNVEIAGDYIQNITQSVQPYIQNFVLGSTICRQFNIDIRNEGFSTIPDFVYLYEDNDSDSQLEWTKYATLLIDSSEVNNQNYYTTFHLTDVMVRFNTELDYTLNDTLLTIVQDICTKHNITLVNQDFYMSDFVLSWQEELSERDLIGYIAEVNGGYAYINEDGDLVISEYSRIPIDTIDINMCSSYKLGEHHLIDRVYVDFAIGSQSYPETSENDTIYLNPQNILLTDSQNYSIENTLKHVYSIIKGFEFYNIEIQQCPINSNLKTGQLIGVGNWGYLQTDDDNYITTTAGERILVSEGLIIPFICTIDWKYNTQWLGGYKTELECKVQEETSIITTQEKLYRINFKIDKEAGEIRQEISNLDENVTASLSLKIDKTDNDQIISMINASADNIILNTKSLIFGSYPDGQYIEVTGDNQGVLFEGTGTITFKPKLSFDLQVINSDETNFYSRIYANAGSIVLSQRDLENNYEMSNTINISTNSGIRSIELANFIVGNVLKYANTIELISSSSERTLKITNYNDSDKVANELILSKNSEDSSQISLANYLDGSIIGQVLINNQQVKITGAGSYIDITDSSILLQTYNSGSYIRIAPSQILINNTTDIMIRKEGGGFIELNSIGDMTLYPIRNLNIKFGASLIINEQYSITFENGYVKYTTK